MIEAVNSVLSNTSATRVVAEQQSTTRSYAANPEKVQEVAQAPYVSPHIKIDRQYNRAILQIRDSSTGDVVNQYPTEGQLKAYQAAQQASLRSERSAEQQVSVGDTPTASVPVPSVDSDVSVPQAGATSVVTSVETEA